MNKKQRLALIIQRLEEIKNSKEIDHIIDYRIIKALEALLCVMPYSTKEKEVKRISGRGLRNGKKKRSHK